MIIANEMHVEINDFKKNCIVFTSDTESNCQGGMSKIGGNPDVPETFTWPVYRVLENGKEVPHYPETPLSFVAQFNLEEIAEYDKDNVLPHHGMLYFFYELGDLFCDVVLKGEHSQRVYYSDVNTGELHEQGYPENIQRRFPLKEEDLVFSYEDNYAAPDEVEEIFSGIDIDEYLEELNKIGYDHEERLEAVDKQHKLLGYADIIQNSMLCTCEEEYSGLRYGNLGKEEQKLFRTNAGEWILLAQIGTLPGDGELPDGGMIGDGGVIYYYIRRADLEKKDFSKVQAFAECF